MDASDPSLAVDPPGPGKLFLAFMFIALQGFGGVLPFARRSLVENRGWLTAEDFNETLALCQSTPGPNIVNLSVVVGARFAGPRGALAAVAGMISAPFVIVVMLGAAYDDYGALGKTAGALHGLAAAAAGLVIATGLRMASPLLKARPITSAGLIITTFTLVALLHWPLPWVMLIMGSLGVALARGAPQ